MKKLVILSMMAVTSLTSSYSFAGSHFISIKSGQSSIDTTRQTVFGRTIDISERDSGFLAVEYQYTYDNNFSIGGEMVQADNRYTDLTSGYRGDIYTGLYLFNAKYNFEMTQWLHSFIGVSAGVSTVELDGPINRNLAGSVFGYGAGITFRLNNHAGLTFQYRQMDSKPEDSAGNVIDMSGSSFTANVSLFF